jgi:hypothetical protein
MFEVGKTYTNKGHGGRIEVLYVGKTTSFVRTLEGNPFLPQGTEYSIDHKHFLNWRQVKPRRSITPEWFNIFEDASNPSRLWLSSTPHKSKEFAVAYAKHHVSAAYKLIDTIEITYTEKADD